MRKGNSELAHEADDFTRDAELATALGDRRFDLAACFGLLHHVPGRAQRRACTPGYLGWHGAGH